MSQTKIEWCDRTWNPVTGCTKISEACEHCYAQRMSKRLAGRYGYPKDNPFQVTLHPDRLSEPNEWKGTWKKKLPKPSRIFVCSMGDLFHEDVPYPFLFKVLDTIYMSQFGRYMALIEPSTFMILTKRPENAKKFFNFALQRYGNKPIPNLWLGVTAENQQRADERIPILLDIPAAVRFVSVEPMLSEINVSRYLKWPLCKQWKPSEGGDEHVYGKYRWVKQSLISTGWIGLDQVICGGETGPGARPMHPDWAKSLRDQCEISGTPFFFKKHGEWGFDPYPKNSKKPYPSCLVENDLMFRCGKKNTGRLLDGQEWNQYPEVRDHD